MTSRERFRETMRYGTPDRVPYFEEGLRDDVLERWREQGLPPEADLAAMFQNDRRERVPVSLEPIPPMKQWAATAECLDELRCRLNLDDPARFPEGWAAQAAAWRSRDFILELPLHRGFFLSMGVHDWPSFAQTVCLIKDAPLFVHEVMGIYAHFATEVAQRVLSEVDVDLVSFSEPIGGNDGPLLSPATYERFVLASYRPVLDLVRSCGVETRCYVTYANARVLLPSVVKAGFNCLWACEVNVEAMDYLSLRDEFGRALRLIGGIDLDVLLRSKAAIRREMARIIPPLLAQGGYVPLADGRVRATVPFDNYRYYRQLLEEFTSSR